MGSSLNQAPPSMGFSRQEVLEWVAISSSRESSQPRDWTQVSHIVDRHLPSEPPGKFLYFGEGGTQFNPEHHLLWNPWEENLETYSKVNLEAHTTAMLREFPWPASLGQSAEGVLREKWTGIVETHWKCLCYRHFHDKHKWGSVGAIRKDLSDFTEIRFPLSHVWKVMIKFHKQFGPQYLTQWKWKRRVKKLA